MTSMLMLLTIPESSDSKPLPDDKSEFPISSEQQKNGILGSRKDEEERNCEKNRSSSDESWRKQSSDTLWVVVSTRAARSSQLASSNFIAARNRPHFQQLLTYGTHVGPYFCFYPSFRR